MLSSTPLRRHKGTDKKIIVLTILQHEQPSEAFAEMRRLFLSSVFGSAQTALIL